MVLVVDVARRSGCPQQAVHRWKKGYQAGGLGGLQIGSSDQAGEPRPPPRTSSKAITRSECYGAHDSIDEEHHRSPDDDRPQGPCA